MFETIKLNMLSELKTGNAIIDMMVSMVVISVLTYILNDRKYYYNKLKDTYTYIIYRNKNVSITYVAKEYGAFNYSQPKTDYPKTYLALLHYISKLDAKNCNIRKLKEIYSRDGSDFAQRNKIEDDDDNAPIEEIKYTIDQGRMKFKINEDIECTIINYIEEEPSSTEKTTQIRKEFSHELTLFTHTKNLNYLKEFTEMCCKEYDDYIKELSIRTQFYETYVSTDRDGYQTFDEYVFQTNRTFNNIFFDNKEEIVERINFFLTNKNWYDKKGIPYTLGMMLYGDPGCGKTSFIKALASLTRRHIIDIPLSRIKTCRELQNVFFKARINNKEIPYDKRILIFEDLDCVSDVIESRELKEKKEQNMKKLFKTLNKKKSDSDENSSSDEDNSSNMINSFITSQSSDDKITLSFILNLIDGILEMPGRILIVTTNYPDKLDKALIRPGRIDMKIHFQRASLEMTLELLSYFYDTNKFKEIDIEELRKIERKWTPAEILQICSKFPNKMENTIKELIT